MADLGNVSLYNLAHAGDGSGLFTNSVDTMLAISHSIEEAVVRHRLYGTFYAGFQRLSAFRRQLGRYRRLAAICGEVVVFAYPDEEVPEVDGVTIVSLDMDDPLVEEWFIVFASEAFLMALMTRQLDDELPAAGRGRFYEGTVTMDPAVVLDAQARLSRASGQAPIQGRIQPPREQDSFSPLLTFNSELIGYLEGRNRQLAAMYRQVNAQMLTLEALQARVRTLVSRTAWEDVKASQHQPASGAQAPQKERLTVMVSDIQGFTRLAERLPSARIVADLNLYFDILASSVYQETGDVDKFMGDGMLAFFQEPRAALRAARRISLRVTEFNAQRMVPFATRLAVVTGPCILARLGSRDRQEFTVLGDTVNLASRLEAYAPTGGIIMDETTYTACALTGGEKAERAIRGRRKPIVTFSLARERLVAKG